MGTTLVPGEGSLEVRKVGFGQSLLPAAGQGVGGGTGCKGSTELCDGGSREERAGGLTEDVTCGLGR